MIADCKECPSGSPSLMTERLRLDRPELADCGDILALANNRKVSEMTVRMPHPYTMEDARQWIARAEAVTDGHAIFAVRLQITGRLIGACGYGSLSGDAREPQLGYWIGEPFWGQSYATEAAHAVLDHAFNAGGHSELVGACRPTNPASRRVLEKCGFQYRDSGMIRSVSMGGAVPIENYVLDRKLWMALKGWGSVA